MRLDFGSLIWVGWLQCTSMVKKETPHRGSAERFGFIGVYQEGQFPASFTLRVYSYGSKGNRMAWMLHGTRRKRLLVFQKKFIVLQCFWRLSFS